MASNAATTQQRRRPRKPSAAQLDALGYLALHRNWLKVLRDISHQYGQGAIHYVVMGYSEQGGDAETWPLRRATFAALLAGSYIERPHPCSADGIEYWYITDAGRRAVEEAKGTSDGKQ